MPEFFRYFLAYRGWRARSRIILTGVINKKSEKVVDKGVGYAF